MTVDDSPQAIRRLLCRKASSAERHRLLVGGRLGLDPTEAEAVLHLARAGEMAPHLLADLLGLTSGGVTAVVQRLERAGRVVRRPHPHDRRSILVALNAATLDLVTEAYAPLVHGVDRVAGDLSEEERHVVAQFLERVVALTERTVEELRTVRSERRAATLPAPELWG
jgi:DNA-binding MarR family transcriptional regulator